MNIIDLDQTLVEDKIIKLAGKKWAIPSDLPVSFMLRLLKVHKRIEESGEDAENQEEAFKIAHEVFLLKQPDLTWEEFTGMITLKQFVLITTAIFDAGDDLAEKKTVEVEKE